MLYVGANSGDMELIPPTELPDWLKGSAEEAEEAD
jgi:hypothetical protein